MCTHFKDIYVLCVYIFWHPLYLLGIACPELFRHTASILIGMLGASAGTLVHSKCF